jgi:hypothetical protein
MCGEAGMSIENRIAAFADGKRSKKAVWRPPGMEDFEADYIVRCFDATIGACGFVSLWRKMLEGGTSRICVSDQEVIRPKSQETLHFHDMYERRWLLQKEIESRLGVGYNVAYEMAPVDIPGMRRPESSLLGGSAVYDACKEVGDHGPTAVSKNHVGAVLCNNPHATKQQIKQAVGRYIPESITRKWNEHTRDAAAVGLTHLYDLKHGEAS